ncbi:MAG: hypothetical protein M1820_007746 [Bogoriella megaspora]|nr:MAG: hypothetical protein M1820_007746 [Bogoriella megaspora]
MAKRPQDAQLGRVAEKRRRIDDGDRSSAGLKATGGNTGFSYHDYTVGLICALPLEMAAARAMLDEIHPDLALDTHDTNAYTLGTICGHNAVIACLPAGVYGTTAAATVASRMLSTFRSIETRLMVGIGGGVPTEKHDIRLGDIVVGVPSPDYAAVVQYDLGKTLADGLFHRTGQLNKPPLSLLTAVSKLQAIHRLGGSQLPSILSKVFDEYPSMKEEYGYPGQKQDVLSTSGCDHVGEGRVCTVCDTPESVQRHVRFDDTPRVHYGPIASGNQVMKHARTRDQIAQQLGILCFEMEAAGLMDNFPCLVVRGICDYSDAQKNKRFQNYAALTAAAYAKELISTIPSKSAITPSTIQENEPEPKLEHRKLVMESLDFDQAESRRATIGKAHLKTCKWLLQRAEFRNWLAWDAMPESNRFLWIKGKPGAGKSTLMKFTLSHIERLMEKEAISISFFFNARGTGLEKSTAGMYRSLLVQLLQKLPKLQNALDSLKLSNTGDWAVDVLKERFLLALESLGQNRLFCFVDALDECPEDQVRDMIAFFEDLNRREASDLIRIHVCFSSRHYPHITISTGLQLVLENQEGHSGDINSYLFTELKIGKSKKAQDIRAIILEKASGVFLWVVLVVRILNKEYDRGQIHALRKRLHDIPTELDELFKDILMRDGQNVQELLLCIQWILYGKRPLKKEEFYYAVLSGQDPQFLSAWDVEEVAIDDMERFILSTSKGLAEMTRSKSPTVQFIHESVREFLLQKDALANIWPDFRGMSEGSTHDRLKDCCYKYMTVDLSPHANIAAPFSTASKKKMAGSRNAEAAVFRDQMRDKFPFLDYAVQHVLHHADIAESGGITQKNFVKNFATDVWIKLANLFQKHDVRRYTPKVSLLYICTDRNLPYLIKIQDRNGSSMHTPDERYASPIYAAITSGSKSAVKALLSPEINLGPDFNATRFDLQLDQEIEAVLNPKSERIKFEPELTLNPLSYMARHGSTLLLNMLIYKVSAKDETEDSLLHEASRIGSEAVMRILINNGADINLRNRGGDTPLHEASRTGYEIAVRLLIDSGANVDSRNRNGESPLYVASRKGEEKVVRLLIDSGADVNSRSSTGTRLEGTPLHAAVSAGDGGVVRLLIDNGAGLDSRNEIGGTPLHTAARKGRETIARLLIDKGADIHAKNRREATPLFEAVVECQEGIARLLVDQGADVLFKNNVGNAHLDKAAGRDTLVAGWILYKEVRPGTFMVTKDVDGSLLLRKAVRASCKTVVQLLIEWGLNINLRDEWKNTPLSYAIAEKDEEMTQWLIDRGADIHSKDVTGATPLCLGGADINPKDSEGQTLLTLAKAKIKTGDTLDIFNLVL